MLRSLKITAKEVEVFDWEGASLVPSAVNTAGKALESDLKSIKNQRFIFPDGQGAGNDSEEVTAYLRTWHVAGDAPSLVALVLASCEKFGIETPDLVQAILMAAILGEVENDLPYHNNLHFKKVVLQLIRLISVHNDIYAQTNRALDAEQIAVLLMGGCIHDLGHDGLGNTVKGVFYSGRLERRSFDLAKPYLEAAGADQEILQKLKVILLTTDVAPFGDVTNPMNQMKAAYRFHFMGESEQYQTLNLSNELEGMEECPKLAMMACLMHEADIATSAGLDYTVTQFETCKLMEEIGSSEAKPIHITDFLDKVCQRRFLSDAGQKLFGANLARIYALAESDEQNGNEPFPKPDHTDFVLGKREASSGEGKTIN